jgi:hypothetical protein
MEIPNYYLVKDYICLVKKDNDDIDDKIDSTSRISDYFNIHFKAIITQSIKESLEIKKQEKDPHMKPNNKPNYQNTLTRKQRRF